MKIRSLILSTGRLNGGSTNSSRDVAGYTSLTRIVQKTWSKFYVITSYIPVHLYFLNVLYSWSLKSTNVHKVVHLVVWFFFKSQFSFLVWPEYQASLLIRIGQHTKGVICRYWHTYTVLFGIDSICKYAIVLNTIF